MSKFIILILLSITFNVSGQSDYFEGRISYKIQYFDSLYNPIDYKSVGSDSLMHYYISGGNYKSLNEDSVLMQLYNQASNKYYFKYQGQMQVMDASINFPADGVAKSIGGQSTVLGYTCSKLSIESANDLTIYHYSEKLKVDRGLYQNHNFGNWNLLLNTSKGALPLKYEVSYPATKMRMIMEAYEIERMDMNDNDFSVESKTGN